MKEFLDQLRDDILNLLFKNLLTLSAVVGVIGMYITIKHPELLPQYTTMVHTWLISKEG